MRICPRQSLNKTKTMVRTIHLLALSAVAATTSAFVSTPSGVRRAFAVVGAEKGFGAPTPAPAPKPMGEAATKRLEAGQSYEAAISKGAPEFAVYARPFGGDETAWKMVGYIACPRSEKPEDMIFGNEAALLSGLFKVQPKMKEISEREGLEYGYRLKVFTDDPVRVAKKQTGKSENPIMNWFGSLTSPVNTDNYKV